MYSIINIQGGNLADFEIEEIKKCKEDFLYFAERYLKVNTPQGTTSFLEYDYHEDLLNFYEQNRFVITNKYRQGGFTTFNILYGLWKCIFNTDKKIMCVFKTDRECCHHSEVIKIAIEKLPDFLKPNLSINNSHEKNFECSNSKMWFITPQSCRSRSADFLFIDEAAFIKNMKQHWQAMYPILSNGGKCFIVSTLNQPNDWFDETLNKSMAGLNQFVPFFS